MRSINQIKTIRNTKAGGEKSIQAFHVHPTPHRPTYHKEGVMVERVTVKANSALIPMGFIPAQKISFHHDTRPYLINYDDNHVIVKYLYGSLKGKCFRVHRDNVLEAVYV